MMARSLVAMVVAASLLASPAIRADDESRIQPGCEALLRALHAESSDHDSPAKFLGTCVNRPGPVLVRLRRPGGKLVPIRTSPDCADSDFAIRDRSSIRDGETDLIMVLRERDGGFDFDVWGEQNTTTPNTGSQLLCGAVKGSLEAVDGGWQPRVRSRGAKHTP